MTDNFTNLNNVEGISEYTVSEISYALKNLVEKKFTRIKVRGEISKLTIAQSGHMYLTLKDEMAILDGVCWRGTVESLTIVPDRGLEIIATGRLSTYSARSSYQLVIEHMELAGEGALLKLIEDRKKKLLAEGLFDENRKKPLPFLPKVIGVVTSPSGAVIRDILHRLRDRFPTHIVLWPASVQGSEAAVQVAQAIEGFNRVETNGNISKPDLIIVARGGGSLEDLWAFNEEIVVRATADSKIPIVSAIGHETDTTLIDFAADYRAPTPTAAAEVAVPVRSELLIKVEDLGSGLVRGLHRKLELLNQALGGLTRAMPMVSRLTEVSRQRLDDRTSRLDLSKEKVLGFAKTRLVGFSGRMTSPRLQLVHKQERLTNTIRIWGQGLSGVLRGKANEIAKTSSILEGVSYQRVLDRGFAFVTDNKGTTITANTAFTGMNLNIQLFDGNMKAEVFEVDVSGRRKRPSKEDNTSD